MEETKTKEQIKADIRGLLLDDAIIKTTAKYHAHLIKSNAEQNAHERIETVKELQRQQQGQEEKQSTETLKTRLNDDLEKATTLQYWLDYYNDKAQWYEDMAADPKPLTGRKDYNDLVMYITDGETVSQNATAKKIARQYGEQLIKYIDLVETVNTYYLKENKSIDDATARRIFKAAYDYFFFGEERTVFTETADSMVMEIKKLPDMAEEFKPYVYALADIRKNNFTLYEKYYGQTSAKEKRTYTKSKLKTKGNVYLELDYYDNLLMSTREPIQESPTELEEKGGLVNVSVTPGTIYKLDRTDIRLDTIIGNIAEDLDRSKKYTEVTLLNIANIFYYESGKPHYTDKQLKEIQSRIVKNMQPLIFEFENERIYAPLINVEIRQKDEDATPTIRINRNQFISEYNKRAKGERVKVYTRNLKDLGLKNTLQDTELAETVRELLTKKTRRLFYTDFQKYYNADSRTEKSRFKKKLKGIIDGYKTICEVKETKEIKKDSRRKTSETIGIAIKYEKKKF